MTPIFATNFIEEAFGPLISVFESIMVFIHDNIVGTSWGLAIVGLTVVVRFVMVPLTVSQFRSMQRMQALAPEIKALQEKYKDDKQRQQQEMMKFYQENKVNPFASCLPLVLQLPVFISLFYMLRTDLKLDICGPALRAHFHVTSNSAFSHDPLSGQLQHITCNQVAPHSAKFLFIPDITAKATGAVLVVLLLLYIGSQVASTLMMSATADKNQRRMMLALPLVFVLFIFSFPAGLLVYWITTNVWTMGQQYFVRRGVGPPPPRPAPVGKQPAAKGAGGSSTNGKADGAAGKPTGEPALAGVGAGSPSAPPPPPRKKKKRSGRRR
jgi:YidC/Oxa1 family membrane protein insertase